MRHCNLLERMALGAAAGLAGTLALQGLLAASKKWLPAAVPPIRRDPGEFMVEKAESVLPDQVRRNIPEWANTVAARGLGLDYGAAFGALYGVLSPDGGQSLTAGAALGMAAWAVGYLGWLQTTGLMPSLWDQTPAQATAPMVEHAVYGVVTAVAYERLRELAA